MEEASIHKSSERLQYQPKTGPRIERKYDELEKTQWQSCHGNFDPGGKLIRPDQFTGKNGPAGPIFSWKNGPGLKILVRPSTFGQRGA